MLPGDLLFVIEEKPHTIFKRQNKHNLSYTVDISLKHALLGAKLEIPLLNGQKEFVNIPHVIQPDFVKTIRGRGMPIAGYSSSYGDLIINFNILFPKQISDDKRKEVERVFDGVDFVSSGPGVLEAVAGSLRDKLDSIRPLMSWIFLLFLFLWMGRR
jgi:DnaJ-class molecular chaperone